MVLSGEAEEEAERTGEGMPWANIKFTNKKKIRDSFQVIKAHNLRGRPDEKLITIEEAGIAAGNVTSHHQLAEYKYHIDLGGGGGTTWTGTIQKLALPGLLFHHVTPTKDYFHDRLVPWKHYIPVAADLSDLRSKFEWAEKHPTQAKWIADQATAFMRNFVSREGYGQMFEEDVVEPLRRAIVAYQPVSRTHPGMTWMEVLQGSPGGDRMEPIIECNWLKTQEGSCQRSRLIPRPVGQMQSLIPSTLRGDLEHSS